MEKDDANIPLEDISISVTVDDRISSQSLVCIEIHTLQNQSLILKFSH